MGEEYVVAKYDYQAKDDQELSLKKGERLVLIDDTRNWWKVRNSKEYEGFVPSNFVRKENWKDTVKGTLRKFPELPRKTSQPNVNKQRAALPAFMRSNSINHTSPDISPMKSPNQSSSMITSAVARFDYQPLREDELQLVKGLRIAVLEKSSDGWWKGQYNDQIGWFPSNYVEEDNNEKSQQKLLMNNIAAVLPTPVVNGVNGGGHREQHPTKQQGKTKNIFDNNANNSNTLLIAVHSFKGQSVEELTIAEGDFLRLIERCTEDPDWCRVSNQRGDIGLIPTSYVRPSSSSSTTMTSNEDTNFYSLEQPAIRETTYSSSSATHRQTTPPRLVSNDGSVSARLRQQNTTTPPTSNNNLEPKFLRSRAQYGRFGDRAWYYGKVSRDESDKVLSNYGVDGDYLIRDSESNPGDFSISLKAQNRNKHFWVRVDHEGYNIGNRRFSTFDDLIEHYTHHPIYTSDRGDKLFLNKPLAAN